ncbi:MAG: 16S rRNA (guanine(527)-N(7))-methyltransferase RsmG [Candidatus Eremiobacteraeota bacterium]|nr:16S rRNA (guanine(527)-N(7))-methyltransferase RsmG [Candidatus Eremiobacteraeota bacterium]
MTVGAKAQLESGLQELGVRNPASVSAKLLEFGTLLLAENQRTNLTGARDLARLVHEHFLDSLAPLSSVELRSPIVDLGSGAGLPGIPVAIAYPDKEVVLVEPRAKRVAFLQSVVGKLGIGNISIIKSSARGPGAAAIAGKAGTVLMRAVAEPETSLGIGLSLLREGGHLLLYEGRASRPTRQQANAASKAGGGKIVIRRIQVPGLAAVRHAWMVRREPKLIRKPSSLSRS